MSLTCVPMILLPAIIVGGMIGWSLRHDMYNEKRNALQIKRMIRRYQLFAFLFVFFVAIGFCINVPMIAMIVANEEFCEDSYDTECHDSLDVFDTAVRLLLPPPIRPHICFVTHQPICESNNANFASYNYSTQWSYYLLMLSGGLLASLTCYVMVRNYDVRKKKTL